MHVECHNCGIVYDVNDKDIPLSGREVQCKECKKVWIIKKDIKQKFLKDYESSIPINTEDLITKAEKSIWYATQHIKIAILREGGLDGSPDGLLVMTLLGSPLRIERKRRFRFGGNWP